MLRDDIEVRPATAPPFRYDDSNHEYLDPASGEVYPHITGLLERAGWVDDRWYTEESSVRGTAIHKATARIDLEDILGLDDSFVASAEIRGWLLAYLEAKRKTQPAYSSIEQPRVHPTWKFAGRIDRGGVVFGRRGIVEIKSGLKEKSHQIQTALQAILIAPWFGALPAVHVARWCLYLKPNGKLRFLPHEDRKDFDEANRILARFL